MESVIVWNRNVVILLIYNAELHGIFQRKKVSYMYVCNKNGCLKIRESNAMTAICFVLNYNDTSIPDLCIHTDTSEVLTQLSCRIHGDTDPNILIFEIPSAHMFVHIHLQILAIDP